MLSTFRYLLRKFSSIEDRIYLNGKHIYGSTEERIDQVFGIVLWIPRLSFRLEWTVFNTCLFPLRTKVRTAAVTVEVLKTNLNQPAPCIGVQNERSKRTSNSPHQTQQSKIFRNSGSPNKSGAKRSLSLGGIRNENVNPQERSASEGISRSLCCEVFQSNTVKELRIHDELTTLDHEKQEETELTVLLSDPNSEFSEGGSKEDPSVEAKDKTPKDPVLRSLIKNTLKRNWKTVVNILLLKVNEAKPFVQQAVRKVTGKEIGVLARLENLSW